MKKTLPYIIITLLVSWLLAGVMFLLHIDASSSLFTIFGMVYMLIPATVAFLLQKYRNREKIKEPLFISFRLNRWFIFAFLMPFFIVLLSLGSSLLLPGVSFSAEADGIFQAYSGKLPLEALEQARVELASRSVLFFFAMAFIQALVAAYTVNGLFALGEELGWRGYMLRHLSHWPFMKVSLFTGVIWGVWHFPLILMGHNYPHHPVIGVFFMIVFCTLLSPLMSYIVIKSRSVITAAIFHGSINAFAGLPLIYLVGGSDLSNGLMGYAGFITIALVTLGFFLFDKYITKENIFSQTVDKSLLTINK